MLGGFGTGLPGNVNDEVWRQAIISSSVRGSHGLRSATLLSRSKENWGATAAEKRQWLPSSMHSQQGGVGLPLTKAGSDREPGFVPPHQHLTPKGRLPGKKLPGARKGGVPH